MSGNKTGDNIIQVSLVLLILQQIKILTFHDPQEKNEENGGLPRYQLYTVYFYTPHKS